MRILIFKDLWNVTSFTTDTSNVPVFFLFFFFNFCVSHLEKDQQPVVPQPTNYKPKVINDIKAQVNKGRLVLMWLNVI